MSDAEFPEELKLELKRAENLRYGENPHQKATLYLTGEKRAGAATAKRVQGKELSYNNLLDADAAFECVAEFDEPAAVIVKHTNPCGAAIGAAPLDAYQKALACDPVSAFGGIVALNRELDAVTTEELVKLFVEVVIAPTASDAALKILAGKPNVRVLITNSMPDPKASGAVVRSVAGGFLVQSRDDKVFEEPSTGGGFSSGGKVVTKRIPTEKEMTDMKFAFTIAKYVKSNAIVYAKDKATIGIGAGQMSRIDSARLSASKCNEVSSHRISGSVMASDAFFPFPDVVEAAAQAGASAIIQPGGSKNDQSSIDAADKLGIAMVFTGVRHFRH